MVLSKIANSLQQKLASKPEVENYLQTAEQIIRYINIICLIWLCASGAFKVWLDKPNLYIGHLYVSNSLSIGIFLHFMVLFAQWLMHKLRRPIVKGKETDMIIALILSLLIWAEYYTGNVLADTESQDIQEIIKYTFDSDSLHERTNKIELVYEALRKIHNVFLPIILASLTLLLFIRRWRYYSRIKSYDRV